MDTAATKAYVEEKWPEVEKALFEVGKVPNQSIDFDPDYFRNGLYEKCMQLHIDYIKRQNIPGLEMKVVKGGPSMAACLYVEIAATDKSGETVLMYGHLDKQPPLTDDWTTTGPYEPKKGTNKYGEGIFCRGLADDQYSTFCAITAVQAVKAQNLRHPRIILLLENEEESGSPHIEFYVKKLQGKIGQPRLVICMDSGGGDYKRLWLTTSLRGLAAGTIKAQLLKNGVHSGGSGVVRDAFHVIRMVMDRLEDAETGKIKMPELYVKCPDQFVAAIEKTADILGDEIWNSFPFLEGCQPQEPKWKLRELYLNKTWRPQLSVIGMEGVPDLKGGNVVREYTSLKISIRLPPTANPKSCLEAIERTITRKAYPMGAKVTFEDGVCAPGFGCPVFEPWLERSMNSASMAYYGNPSAHYGEGGSIPFMDFLQKNYEKAQFMVLGLIGPEANAHAPDEYLNIGMLKGLMCCVANVLVDASNHFSGDDLESDHKANDNESNMTKGTSAGDVMEKVLAELTDLKGSIKRMNGSMEELRKNNKSLGERISELNVAVYRKSETI